MALSLLLWLWGCSGLEQGSDWRGSHPQTLLQFLPSAGHRGRGAAGLCAILPDAGDGVLQPVLQPKRVSTAESPPGIFAWHPEEKFATGAKLSNLTREMQSPAGVWPGAWGACLWWERWQR